MKTKRITNPTNDKELIQNILYRLERIEQALKIHTEQELEENNPAQNYLDLSKFNSVKVNVNPGP